MGSLPSTGDEVVYHLGQGHVVPGIVRLVIESGGVREFEVEFAEDVPRRTRRGSTRTLQFKAFDVCTTEALRSPETALWARLEYVAVSVAQGRLIGPAPPA